MGTEETEKNTNQNVERTILWGTCPVPLSSSLTLLPPDLMSSIALAWVMSLCSPIDFNDLISYLLIKETSH